MQIREQRMPEARTERAVELMARFAERTGLESARPQRRYLWTDAFAVCNFLGLRRSTGHERYTDLALRLVDRVHQTLGRHRAGDQRSGWLSGLGTEEGEAHPTCGGLRIGKSLPERGAEEPFAERLEWDRDGQYFHYLTKWMHALDQATRRTSEPRFNLWARELAVAAHRAFTYVPRGGGPKRMRWKMSIDLSRPLVSSMGQHDPLDGLVTYLQLDATADFSQPSLADATADFAAMLEPRALATSDPLGLGGLLGDAYRVHQLTQQAAPAIPEGLLDALLAAALVGVSSYVQQPDLRSPATRRLAFRELGLAIGLAAVALLAADAAALGAAARASLDRLVQYAPVRTEIESFWLRTEHRETQLWLEHADINDVMLATSLAPEGFLVLQPATAAVAGR
jgi:hypothetical protein